MPMTSVLVTRNCLKSWTSLLELWIQLWKKFLSTQTMEKAATAPITPCTSPSSMKGTRMNQFEAPTSFITATSRRRAKMAIRMVLRISRHAAPRSTRATAQSMIWRNLVIDTNASTSSLA